jgi:hypothetical protein
LLELELTMGSASNSLNVMEIRCNQEHPSITRLKKLLPPEVLALVVKRIAKGDMLTSILRYLHITEKGIADETFRKWLQPLAIEVRELLVERMPIEDVAKIIGDSSAATA